MSSDDVKVLERAIKQAQAIKHKGKLSTEISDAQRLLEVRIQAGYTMLEIILYFTVLLHVGKPVMHIVFNNEQAELSPLCT